MSDGQQFMFMLIGALLISTTAIAVFDTWLSRRVDDDIRREIRS